MSRSTEKSLIMQLAYLIVSIKAPSDMGIAYIKACRGCLTYTTVLREKDTGAGWLANMWVCYVHRHIETPMDREVCLQHSTGLEKMLVG